MKEHIPDKLPPLIVDMPDHYGFDATHVLNPPINEQEAHERFNLCKVAIARRSERIQNAYPANIGGVEQFFALRALAKHEGVELQFSSSDESTV